jgi:uroporphyrinogen decarboxylase
MQLKGDTMTSKERLAAFFRNERPDRVGLHALSTSFNLANAGHPVRFMYDEPEKSFEAMQWTFDQYGWETALQYCPHTVLAVWDFGGELRMPQGPYEGALVVVSHPVKGPEDTGKLKLPDPQSAGRIPHAMRFAQLQAEHALPVTFYTRSPFTFAANLPGVDTFCKWTIKKPELCEQLMSIALEHMFRVLGFWADAFGPENLFVWMSSPTESNQVVSPRAVRKLALPFHLAFHQRLKALGIKRFGFHICGDQNLNLPLLAEASPWPHPAVLSFGHEVDLEKAGRMFPQDIIYGNIEPALMQTATPQAIYENCLLALKKGKKAPGGFILGTGCGLPPTVPPVNVFALTKAVYDHGWYE